jgi:predicted nuclease with TOPRIM domain
MTKYFVILLFFTTLGGLGYKYYTDTSSTIQRLTKENAELVLSIDSCNASLQSMEEQRKRLERNAEVLAKDLKKSESYVDGLYRKLREHDLTNLALKKPELIEKRVNEATRKIFDDIESDAADGL